MKIPALAALLAASALVVSACGGGSSGTTAGSAPQPARGLHVATTSLGKVLVDGEGRTVYLLTADGHDTSTCGAGCLAVWPAVAPGHAKLGVATGSTATPDGTMTMTVAGHPVYVFSEDHGPGDVNGEGLKEFGGTWYAVSATGAAVTGASGSSTSPSGSSSSTSTGRGYGY